MPRPAPGSRRTPSPRAILTTSRTATGRPHPRRGPHRELPALAADPWHGRLGRGRVAQGLRWPGRPARSRRRSSTRSSRALRRQHRRVRDRARHGRPHARCDTAPRSSSRATSRRCCAATRCGASSSASPGGFRPRLAAARRRSARRRRVGGHRAEGVDLAGLRVAAWASCSPAPIPTCPSTRASPTSSSTWPRPGIEVRPLRQITGHAHFSEVFLDEVRIPSSMVVNGVGGGWKARGHHAVERAGRHQRERPRKGVRAGGRLGAEPEAASTTPLVRQRLADC